MMTDQERIDEINQDIADARQWIRNMGKTGQEYDIGTGPSARKFVGFSMTDIRKYINTLKQELADLSGDSGYQVIF